MPLRDYVTGGSQNRILIGGTGIGLIIATVVGIGYVRPALRVNSPHGVPLFEISGSGAIGVNSDFGDADECLKSGGGSGKHMTFGTCGSGGGSVNTGAILNAANDRFVNVSGDTMTGALVIQNGTVHSATTAALLRVRGTMSGYNVFTNGTLSGANLRATGSAYSYIMGNLGIGTTLPKATLDVVGTVSGSALTVSSFPATRIPFMGAGGSMTTSANMIWNGAQIDLNSTGNTGFRTYVNGGDGWYFYNGAGGTGNFGMYDIDAGKDRMTLLGDSSVQIGNQYGNPDIYIDTSRNVAIGKGINTIKAKLDVAGTISGALITQNGAGSNYFRGNVGIGNSAPKTTLDVIGTISGSALRLNGDAIVRMTSTSASGVVINGLAGQVSPFVSFRNAAGFAKLQVNSSGYLQSQSGITVVSRPNMGSFGGDFTFQIKRDGSNNFGNGAILRFTDNNTNAYIKWVANSFSQGVMDLEFHNANGLNMSMPNAGGIYMYNPVQNSQDISILKVPASTLYPGGGTWPYQAVFKFDPQTFAGTSPLTVTRAIQLYIRSAPIRGGNMTFSKSTAAQFDTGGSNYRGLIIRGGNSQSGALMEFTNTGHTILSAFTASGYLALGGQNVKKSLVLEAYGSMSGASLTLSGLRNCDTIDTNAAGLLSCGTDSTGGTGSFGSGNVITIGNQRYVSKQGDTMTGALTIQNGNTHTATATPLLNVRGTMSGRSLYITGTGGSALVMTNITTGRVGIGTASPKAKLDVVGTISGSALTVSSITSGRVTFAGAGGSITSDSALSWDNTNKTLGVGTTASTNSYEKMLISGSEATGNGIASILQNTATTGAGNPVFAIYSMRTGTSPTADGVFFGGKATAYSAYGIVNGITMRPGQSTQDLGLAAGSANLGTAAGPALIIKSNTKIGIGDTTGWVTGDPSYGQVEIISKATATPSLVLKGASNHATSLLEFRRYDGTYIGGMSQSGWLSLGRSAGLAKTSIDVIGTISGSLITQNGAGNNYFMGNFGLGKIAPSTKLDVIGTMSGSRLVVSGNSMMSGALVVKGNITSRGTISGALLSVDSVMVGTGYSLAGTFANPVSLAATAGASNFPVSSVISANTLKAGDTYRIAMTGTGKLQSASAGVGIRSGTNVIAKQKTGDLGGFNDASETRTSHYPWMFEAIVTVNSIGASGVLRSQAKEVFGGSATGTVLTLDTTANITLTPYVDFTGTAAGEFLSLTSFTIERLRP